MRYSVLLSVFFACACGLPPFPTEGVPAGITVNPNDIGQRDYGDCWLDATLIAYAAKDPVTLESRIHRVGAQYIVGLYDKDGNPHWYPVDPNAPSATYPTVNPDGGIDWGYMFEQAFTADGFPVTQADSPSVVFVPLSGRLALTWPIDIMSGDTLRSQLRLANKHPAVLTSAAHPSDTSIVGAHAYAVMSFENDVAHLKNPWGFDDVYVSLADIRANFLELDIGDVLP